MDSKVSDDFGFCFRFTEQSVFLGDLPSYLPSTVRQKRDGHSGHGDDHPIIDIDVEPVQKFTYSASDLLTGRLD